MKQRYSNKNDIFIKILLKVNKKHNSGVLRIDHIIPKLLTLSAKRLQLNCWFIQQLVSLLHYCYTENHISHFTNHLRF